MREYFFNAVFCQGFELFATDQFITKIPFTFGHAVLNCLPTEEAEKKCTILLSCITYMIEHNDVHYTRIISVFNNAGTLDSIDYINLQTNLYNANFHQPFCVISLTSLCSHILSFTFLFLLFVNSIFVSNRYRSRVMYELETSK